MIVWTYIGTFNFQDIFHQVRAPLTDSHGDSAGPMAGKFVRATATPDATDRMTVTPAGPDALLFPLSKPEHYHPAAAVAMT